MVYKYKNNDCFELDEFIKFVNYAFDLCDNMKINELHKHVDEESKCIYEKILEKNPTRYIPHIKELIYWKKLKINTPEISKEILIKLASCTCNKMVVFNKLNNSYKSCCPEHSKEFRIKNSKIKTLLKHGVEYNLQNKETLKKTQEHWGESKTPFISEEVRNKSKQTMLKRYGKDNAMKVKKFCDKSRETRRKIYGSEFANSEKAKLTLQSKYGVSYFSQSEKFKKLWPKNGGDENFNNIIREKEYRTKKKNNSFPTSKPEKRILCYLIEIFGSADILTQYKSERYPFKCDFYIKSKDLFIEYQGSWTHGDHPFNPNNKQDLKTLSILKEKSNKNLIKNGSTGYYDNAIYVWTELDPKKRKFAKQHNLNWIEFFSENEITKWLEEYK